MALQHQHCLFKLKTLVLFHAHLEYFPLRLIRILPDSSNLFWHNTVWKLHSPYKTVMLVSDLVCRKVQPENKLLVYFTYRTTSCGKNTTEYSFKFFECSLVWISALVFGVFIELSIVLTLKGVTYCPSGVTSPVLLSRFSRGILTLWKTAKL